MKTDKIVLSPWFMSALFALALLTPPYASKGFAPNIIPDIVAATLSNSFVKHLVPYSFIFQITALLFFLGVVIRKDKFGKAFTAFAGISFIVYAFVQNIAITDKFGVSLVLSNILLCFLTSFMWLRDLRQNRNRYIFRNFNRRNAWLLPIAFHE